MTTMTEHCTLARQETVAIMHAIVATHTRGFSIRESSQHDLPNPVTIFYADATIRDARGRTIAKRNQVITPDVHTRVCTEYPDVQPYGYTVFTDANDARAHIRADNGAHYVQGV